MTAGTTPGGTHYRVEGSGPPLVLIHGVGLDLEMWDGQAAVLAPHFQVIRYDLLGHGGSVNPPGARDLSDFADQLGGLLADLKLGPVILAGFSIGGLIAQTFVLAQPEKVSRLVLMYTVFDRTPEQIAAVRGRYEQVRAEGPEATIETNIKRWFNEEFIATKPAVVDYVRRRLQTNDVEGFLKAYAIFSSPDEERAALLHNIACPTLVMTGADDVGSTPEMARRMADRLPDSRLAIIADQRHMGPAENPAPVNEALLDFLRPEAGPE